MQVESYEEMLVQFPEYRLLKALLLYVPPVLLILGTLGNVFSFIILRRRAMLKVSSYHYLASLAVADSLVLYIGLLRLWLGEVTGRDLSDSADWLCKLTVSFGYTASDLSVWLIIAVTVERYIVVCFPLKASAMISTRRAKRVIALLGLIMFTLNLHFFFTVEIVDQGVEGKNVTVSNCEAAPRYQRLVNEVWPWVDACIYSFLPFIVILALNVLIITEVVEARQHRQLLQNTPEHHRQHVQHSKRIRPALNSSSGSSCVVAGGRTCYRRGRGPGEGTKLTLMLLTVSFTFLLTTLPMNVSLIVTAFWQHHSSLRQTVQFRLARTVAELLMYVNHSANFFLYCATGQKFRQQIVQMMTCRSDSSASLPWTSLLQTEDSRVSTSVAIPSSSVTTRNGHQNDQHHQHHQHPHRHMTAKESLAAQPGDASALGNGEAVPLKTLIAPRLVACSRLLKD